RRQLGAPESRAGAEVDQQAGQQLQPAALNRAGDGPERGELTNPAQRDGRARLDVSHVGLDGLPDLPAPVGLGVDGRLDAPAEYFDVGGQQFDETFFLAGELVV